jgi:hypothetical protein
VGRPFEKSPGDGAILPEEKISKMPDGFLHINRAYRRSTGPIKKK